MQHIDSNNKCNISPVFRLVHARIMFKRHHDVKVDVNNVFY